MYGANSGYRNDGNAGLTYVAARYYDSKIGPFTTHDTYLDQKPYQYCENDPVSRHDPSDGDHVDLGGILPPNPSIGQPTFPKPDRPNPKNLTKKPGKGFPLLDGNDGPIFVRSPPGQGNKPNVCALISISDGSKTIFIGRSAGGKPYSQIGIVLRIF